MQGKQDVALRKRQQIANANKMMFLWVAGASVIIGASVVLLWTLGQKLIFNQQIINEKNKTVSALDYNKSVVDKLKDNVRVLNTNESLSKLLTPADGPNGQPVSVVLDALPPVANADSLGASLQSTALLNQPCTYDSNTNPSDSSSYWVVTSGCVQIESLAVTPVSTDASSSSSSGGDANSIQFTFSISTNSQSPSAFKHMLQSIERSIRTISISSVQVEQQGDKLVMTVSGEAFYQPGVQIQLNKVLVPKASNTKAAKK